MQHRHEGIDLNRAYLEATLENLYTIWNRPVHLETEMEDVGKLIFSFGPDGNTVWSI